MSQLGIGVMLGSLSGNAETVDSVKSSLGKTIKYVRLDEGSDSLRFEFEDGSELKLWDGGQSCCEHRYMATDDNLSDYFGAKLLDMELKDGSHETDDEWGDVHEIQFLDVVTDKGTFQMSNHNEHNGYYGGFWIQASIDQ